MFPWRGGGCDLSFSFFIELHSKEAAGPMNIKLKVDSKLADIHSFTGSKSFG